MSTTITIRTAESLRRKLEERAAASGKSLSELIREVLENAVSERPLSERVGHLRGSLSLQRKSGDPWRRHLREQNWRS